MWEIIVIAVGLSMDAFAAAVCKGLSAGRIGVRHMLAAGLYFGGFQALMPTLGFLLGVRFQSYIEAFDHWIAFALLAAIGLNMLIESRKRTETLDASFSPVSMLPLALSTSIDALAAGVTFAIADADIRTAAPIIGVITFLLSAVGVKLGNAFGAKQKARAELFGGLTLIFMGAKILLEHLGVV